MKTQCRLLEPGPHCQMPPSNQKFFPVAPGCSESKQFAQPRDVMVGVSANRTRRSAFFRNLVEQTQKLKRPLCMFFDTAVYSI